MKTIVITFKDDKQYKWNKEKWDDYSYEGPVFVVKRNSNWIGIYNMSEVRSIVVQ